MPLRSKSILRRRIKRTATKGKKQTLSLIKRAKRNIKNNLPKAPKVF